MSATLVIRKISLGVNARVTEQKRGGALGAVLLSKKRVAELNALKTSPFYQRMTLNEGRDDRIVFTLKLGSMDEAEAFFADAISSANAVGVGSSAELKTVGVRASKETVSA